MSLQTHYQVLGLAEGCSQLEIEKAYTRLSKELNPKNHEHSEFFREEYNKVVEAYNALKSATILAAQGADLPRKPKPQNKKEAPESKPPIAATTSKNIFMNNAKAIRIGAISLVFLLFVFALYQLFAPNPPIYLADNGVTLKAELWSKPGDEAVIKGTLYTVVDSKMLKDKIESGDLLRVCTTLITDMSALFKDKKGFDQDIGSWDLSNVTTTGSMFRGASSFNQDIGGWNVGKVREMAYMFEDASSFNQDLSGWNVSGVDSKQNFDYSTPSWSLSKPRFRR